MAKRYVDANILDDLANSTSSSRGDLQEVLSMSGWRVNEAPGRGWDHGAWADVRSTISTELRLLDDDMRSLRDRARRTRTASAEVELMRWLEGGWATTRHELPQFIAEVGKKAFEEVVSRQLALFALRQISLGMTANNLWSVSGPGMWRMLSDLGAAKTLRPDTFFARLGTRFAAKLLVGTAVTTIFAFMENMHDYSKEGLAVVVSGTLIDTALLVGCSTVIGAGLVLAAPALGVGLAGVATTLAVGLAVGWAIGKVRETGPYKEMVRKSGAALNEVGKYASDIGTNAMNTAKTATKYAAGGLVSAISAGKRIDAALTQSISAVTKPFDTVGSWFAPQKLAHASVA